MLSFAAIRTETLIQLPGRGVAETGLFAPSRSPPPPTRLAHPVALCLERADELWRDRHTQRSGNMGVMKTGDNVHDDYFSMLLRCAQPLHRLSESCDVLQMPSSVSSR